MNPIKKSIGWTDMTCNPIKGKCKGGCWYCYYSGERGIANRFKHDPTIMIRLDIFDKLPKKPKRIFLCSTHDLFGGWVLKRWREEIFLDIEEFPQHTFQILTKFPRNIDRPMPDNVWLGITITGERREWEAFYLGFMAAAQARLRFISIEPLLFPMPWIKDLSYLKEHFKWIIVGRLTQHGHKYDPEKEWIEQIVNKAKSDGIPIFLKDNLKEIWGDQLIQEFPK